MALSRFAHPQHPLEALGGGTPIASMFLPVRVGGDVALLKGVMKELLDEDLRRHGHAVDHAFVERHTEGFAAFAEALAAEPWDRLVDESGIAREAMRALADLLGGHAQDHRLLGDGADAARARDREHPGDRQPLADARARWAGRARASARCAATATCRAIARWGSTTAPAPALLDALARRFGFAPPRAHGLDVVGAIEAMHAGRVRLLFALGGNFLSASPDTDATARALRGCALTAHVATKLNRAHLVTGREALLLPCLGRSERDVQAGGPQFVTVEDSMGAVHASQGVLRPAGAALRSEPAIVAGLAQAVLGARTRVRWSWLVGGLRPHPRRHRRRHPRIRGVQRARPDARAASSCRTRCASCASRPKAGARSSPSTRCPRAASRPGSCC